MASVFTKIINGEIPGYKIAENDQFIAFLDVFPLVAGHTLIVPKEETDYIFDMEAEQYKAFWAFAQTVAKAVGKAIPCKRVGVAVIGLEVPHAHIHLVPLNTVGDINFSQPKLKLPAEEMAVIADKIRQALV